MQTVIKQAFEDAYGKQNYKGAYQCVLQALDETPASAYRYFFADYSYPFARVLELFGKVDEMATGLESLFFAHPHMNALCEDTPALEAGVSLREENIRKRLPSMVLMTQGKSGSVSVASIFHSGFHLPLFGYSLVHLRVIPAWLKDYSAAVPAM